MKTSTPIALAVASLVAAGVLVAPAAPAQAVETVLRIGTVHETIGQARADALIRMPVVLAADETLTPATLRVVRAGTTTALPSQIADARYDGTRITAADVFVVDDVAAGATVRYEIRSGGTASSTTPMPVTTTASAVSVTGDDLAVQFARTGAQPGTISSLTAGGASAVASTVSGGIGPRATLRLESLASSTMNADVETGTGTTPTGWTGARAIGDEVLAWSTAAWANGERSLEIDTRASASPSTMDPNARLVDFAGAGYTETGTWRNSSQAGYNQPTHRISSIVGSTATWRPTSLVAGSYDVYIWVPSTGSANANNPPAASYAVTHTGGTATVVVDQRVNTGQFFKIGTWSMGADAAVALTVGTAVNHRADTVLFQPAGVPIAGSAAVTPRGSWTSAAVPVAAGERVFVKSWAKTQALAAPATASTIVTFASATGAAVGTAQTVGAFTGTTWLPLSKNLTVPATATSMRVQYVVEGTARAWFDNLTVYRAAASASPMSGTSATQRNVSVTAEAGPILTTVKVVNQLMVSGAAQPAFQLVTYRIPRQGTTLSQTVEYRGTAAVEESTVAAEATATSLLAGGFTLGTNGATGDAASAFSPSQTVIAGDPNTVSAIVDTGSAASLVVSGSNQDTISSAATTSGQLAIAGPTRVERGASTFGYRLYRHDRTFASFSLLNSATPATVRARYLADTNALVAGVDDPSVTMAASFAPRLKQLNDVVLNTSNQKLASSSWSGRALAAYVNWEITGIASYKTRGDSIVNAHLTPQVLTVEYQTEHFENNGPLLDEQTMDIPQIYHYNPDPRLPQYAEAIGLAAIDVLGFEDNYGHNALAASVSDFGSLESRVTIKNMTLYGGLVYVWGMKQRGNAEGMAWLKDAFESPVFSSWVAGGETAYTGLLQGAYVPVKGDAQAYYTATLAFLLPELAQASGGEITIVDPAQYSLNSTIMIDNNQLGGDSSGWPQWDYLQTHRHRLGWSPAAAQLVAATTYGGDGVEGVTTAVRMLDGYLDLTEETVSNDSGEQMIPNISDPDYGRQFSVSWLSIDELSREVNPGVASSMSRVMSSAYFNWAHPDALG